ncbi:MAG: helix-turn-helix transcriptional regulator, partial [Candidatus Omnitrophica bacterium]|nr:helix-turn-helix transcriptional regulator [Candidatus Omnitrophota bacterium]
WYKYAELIFGMSKGRLIDREEVLSKLTKALTGLEKQKYWDKYAELIFGMLDEEVLLIDVVFLKEQRELAKQAGFAFVYYFKTVQLSRIFNIKGQKLSLIREQGKELISKIKVTNEGATRDDQRIDFAYLEQYSLYGLATLQFISPELTKGLISGHCQRGYLPLLIQDIEAASYLEIDNITAIRSLMERLQSTTTTQLTPSFMMQVVNFANAYEEVGLSIDIFKQALTQHTQDEAIFSLARGLVEELAKQFDIHVSLGDKEAVKSILKDWNLGYLGSMVSASRRWQDIDRQLFRLVLRTALEGKFHALLYPDEYPDIDFSNYSQEEKGLIAKIRTYNDNFRKKAEQAGIDIDILLHPERIEPKLTTAEALLVRDWRVVLKDFVQRFKIFREWFNESEFSKSADSKRVFDRAIDSLGPYRILIEDNKDETKLQIGLLKQKNNLNKLFKLLQRIQKQIPPSQPLPPKVADLINIIQEIRDYDFATYKTQSKALRMRFWRRIPGRDAVIANQVRSCTGLDQDARAIFEYLLDLGTIYLILEDPDTQTERGYVRFFVGLNKQGKPSIFVDSADGKANRGSFEPIKEAVDFIEEFAFKCNIKPKNVTNRVGDIKVKAKLGGALTDKYKHHAGITISEFSTDRENGENGTGSFSTSQTLASSAKEDKSGPAKFGCYFLLPVFGLFGGDGGKGNRVTKLGSDFGKVINTFFLERTKNLLMRQRISYLLDSIDLQKDLVVDDIVFAEAEPPDTWQAIRKIIAFLRLNIGTLSIAGVSASSCCGLSAMVLIYHLVKNIEAINSVGNHKIKEIQMVYHEPEHNWVRVKFFGYRKEEWVIFDISTSAGENGYYGLEKKVYPYNGSSELDYTDIGGFTTVLSSTSPRDKQFKKSKSDSQEKSISDKLKNNSEFPCFFIPLIPLVFGAVDTKSAGTLLDYAKKNEHWAKEELNKFLRMKLESRKKELKQFIKTFQIYLVSTPSGSIGVSPYPNHPISFNALSPNTIYRVTSKYDYFLAQYVLVFKALFKYHTEGNLAQDEIIFKEKKEVIIFVTKNDIDEKKRFGSFKGTTYKEALVPAYLRRFYRLRWLEQEGKSEEFSSRKRSFKAVITSSPEKGHIGVTFPELSSAKVCMPQHLIPDTKYVITSPDIVGYLDDVLVLKAKGPQDVIICEIVEKPEAGGHVTSHIIGRGKTLEEATNNGYIFLKKFYIAHWDKDADLFEGSGSFSSIPHEPSGTTGKNTPTGHLFKHYGIYVDYLFGCPSSGRIEISPEENRRVIFEHLEPGVSYRVTAQILEPFENYVLVFEAVSKYLEDKYIIYDMAKRPKAYKGAYPHILGRGKTIEEALARKLLAKLYLLKWNQPKRFKTFAKFFKATLFIPSSKQKSAQPYAVISPLPEGIKMPKFDNDISVLFKTDYFQEGIMYSLSSIPISDFEISVLVFEAQESEEVMFDKPKILIFGFVDQPFQPTASPLLGKGNTVDEALEASMSSVEVRYAWFREIDMRNDFIFRVLSTNKGMKVAQRFKGLRKEKGYSQASLGKEVGFFQGAVGQVETGKAKDCAHMFSNYIRPLPGLKNIAQQLFNEAVQELVEKITQAEWLGFVFRDIREWLGLSRKEMSNLIGTNETALRKIERRVMWPTINMWDEIESNLPSGVVENFDINEILFNNLISIKNIGEIVNKLRRWSVLKKDEIAKRAGIDPAVIGDVENGRNSSVEILVKISSVLTLLKRILIDRGIIEISEHNVEDLGEAESLPPTIRQRVTTPGSIAEKTIIRDKLRALAKKAFEEKEYFEVIKYIREMLKIRGGKVPIAEFVGKDVREILEKIVKYVKQEKGLKDFKTDKLKALELCFGIRGKEPCSLTEIVKRINLSFKNKKGAMYRVNKALDKLQNLLKLISLEEKAKQLIKKYPKRYIGGIGVYKLAIVLGISVQRLWRNLPDDRKLLRWGEVPQICFKKIERTLFFINKDPEKYLIEGKVVWEKLAEDSGIFTEVKITRRVKMVRRLRFLLYKDFALALIKKYPKEYLGKIGCYKLAKVLGIPARRLWRGLPDARKLLGWGKKPPMFSSETIYRALFLINKNPEKYLGTLGSDNLASDLGIKSVKNLQAVLYNEVGRKLGWKSKLRREEIIRAFEDLRKQGVKLFDYDCNFYNPVLDYELKLYIERFGNKTKIYIKLRKFLGGLTTEERKFFIRVSLSKSESKEPEEDIGVDREKKDKLPLEKIDKTTEELTESSKSKDYLEESGLLDVIQNFLTKLQRHNNSDVIIALISEIYGLDLSDKDELIKLSSEDYDKLIKLFDKDSGIFYDEDGILRNPALVLNIFVAVCELKESSYETEINQLYGVKLGELKPKDLKAIVNEFLFSVDNESEIRAYWFYDGEAFNVEDNAIEDFMKGGQITEEGD